MSGPKRSRYEIERERRQREYEKRRRAREENRNQQIQEIEDELNRLKRQAVSLSPQAQANVSQWMEGARDYFDGDLREAWGALKGIKKYIHQKQAEQQRKQEKARQEKEEQVRRDEIISEWSEKLTSIPIQCPIMSGKPSLHERIDLLQQSLETNPDNENTRKQIDQLVTSTLEAEQKAKDERLDHQIVSSSVYEVFGGADGGADMQTDKHGKTTISGKLNGMPVSVHLKPGSDSFDMDTPERGDCGGTMEQLMSGLRTRGVGLGPIHVTRTGQKIGATQKNTSHRQKHDA